MRKMWNWYIDTTFFNKILAGFDVACLGLLIHGAVFVYTTQLPFWLTLVFGIIFVMMQFWLGMVADWREDLQGQALNSATIDRKV